MSLLHCLPPWPRTVARHALLEDRRRATTRAWAMGEGRGGVCIRFGRRTVGLSLQNSPRATAAYEF